MEINNKGNEPLSWNEEIAEDSIGGVVLPPGTYKFAVQTVTKKIFSGSDKLPACDQAVINLKIFDNAGEVAQINHTFSLLRKFEGKIGNFFVSVGLKEAGKPFVMDWKASQGKQGFCEIENSTYNGSTFNRVKKFIDQNSEEGQQKIEEFYNSGVSTEESFEI